MGIAFRALELLMKLAGLAGGLCALSIVAASALTLTGSPPLPGPFSGGDPIGLGRYVLEAGSIVVVAFLTWRVALTLQGFIVARRWRELTVEQQQEILDRMPD